MSIDRLRSRFIEYTKLFPDEIIKVSAEIQSLEDQLTSSIDNDIKKIKKVISDKKLSIKLNFRKYEEPTYLLVNTLYSSKKRPSTKQDIIRFLLANLFMCKKVLLQILVYIKSAISRMVSHYDNFENKTNNYLVRIWHYFIGCCETMDLLITEYLLIIQKIYDKLDDTKRALILDYPDRNKIRDGIHELLISSKNAQYTAMPVIRLALELPLLEDVGIKIKYKLNRKKRTKKIKDIIPLANIKPDDIFSLMLKMELCDQQEFAVLTRIYEWGSKSVHKGQVIPLSTIWYSYFFTINELIRITGRNSKLSYTQTKKEYDELIKNRKIKVAIEGQTYDPSFSNF